MAPRVEREHHTTNPPTEKNNNLDFFIAPHKLEKISVWLGFRSSLVVTHEKKRKIYWIQVISVDPAWETQKNQAYFIRHSILLRLHRISIKKKIRCTSKQWRLEFGEESEYSLHRKTSWWSRFHQKKCVSLNHHWTSIGGCVTNNKKKGTEKHKIAKKKKNVWQKFSIKPTRPRRGRVLKNKEISIASNLLFFFLTFRSINTSFNHEITRLNRTNASKKQTSI